MILKRRSKLKTSHLQIVLYTYLWLIIMMSYNQTYPLVQTKSNFKYRKIPWIQKSIVLMRNFHNVNGSDRLEKRSISQYTYANDLSVGNVPKFTYILPKNSINSDAHIMQLNKKTGVVDDNMGHSTILDQYSISSLNKTESATEKYGYFEEYSIQNSLSKDETNYMNNVFNYYEQHPTERSSFNKGKQKINISNAIETDSIKERYQFKNRWKIRKPIKKNGITNGIIKTDRFFKGLSNKIEKLITGKDPSKTASDRLGGLPGGPLITSHVVTTSIHPWIFPFLHATTEPYMSFAIFIIITIVEFFGIFLGYKLDFLGIRATDPPSPVYVKASSDTIIDLCAGVTCNVGETCTEGICKCGSSATCSGMTSGEFCDASGNQCKCAASVDACSGGETCFAGECKCGTSSSCVGQASGAFCDSANNQCKCSASIAACTNSGETCTSGACKCGTASTCVGQASGSFCDSANNICKCSSTVAACSGTTDTCTAGVCKCGSADACSNSGETCSSGSCKCGTASTCVGQTSGSFCDAANNVCKCSSTVASCSGTSDTCTSGVCKCGTSDACSNSGETCSSGSCKCGTASTCVGQTTGSFCDAANNVCKCSASVAACSGTSDTCTAGVCKCGSADACSISGETCNSGTCKCGTAATCSGQTTGSYCDAANNVCKCSATVDACSGTSDTCTNGVCKCGTSDACSISGETCSSGSCKCGTSTSCSGLTTGSFCDAANNVCKCSATVASCSGTTDTCTNGVCKCGSNDACSISGETCQSGTCKCGTASSCSGQTSGSYCDAANNVCKCSATVDACSGTTDTCTNGVCKCGSSDPCSVSGETCSSGTCKCGTASSCAGLTTGSYCDAANNVCKCSATVDSCSGTSDTCTNGVCKCGTSDACSISGETCVSGACKCGTASSCAGVASGSFCDAANNVCKCSATVAACSGTTDTCTGGVCKCGTSDACSNSGETCSSGACKCGTADSCVGQITGTVCDAANNVCKCSSTVAKCASGEECSGGTCVCELCFFYEIIQRSMAKLSIYSYFNYHFSTLQSGMHPYDRYMRW